MSRVVKGLEGEKDETFAENDKGEWLGVESRMLLEEARLRLAIEVQGKSLLDMQCSKN